MRREDDTKIFELKYSFKLLPIDSPLKRHRVQLTKCNHLGLLDADDHAHGGAELVQLFTSCMTEPNLFPLSVAKVHVCYGNLHMQGSLKLKRAGAP